MTSRPRAILSWITWRVVECSAMVGRRQRGDAMSECCDGGNVQGTSFAGGISQLAASQKCSIEALSHHVPNMVPACRSAISEAWFEPFILRQDEFQMFQIMFQLFCKDFALAIPQVIKTILFLHLRRWGIRQEGTQTGLRDVPGASSGHTGGDKGVGTRWAKRHKGAQGRLSEKVRDMYVQQLHLLRSYRYIYIWIYPEGSLKVLGGLRVGTTPDPLHGQMPSKCTVCGWGPYPSSHDNVGIQNPTVHHPCRNSSRWKDLGSWLANLGCHYSWHFVAVLKLWLSDSREEKKKR